MTNRNVFKEFFPDKEDAGAIDNDIERIKINPEFVDCFKEMKSNFTRISEARAKTLQRALQEVERIDKIIKEKLKSMMNKMISIHPEMLGKSFLVDEENWEFLIIKENPEK